MTDERSFFCDYFSGFISATKGFFYLRQNPIGAGFEIRLNDDDTAMVEKLQSFFGCGSIYQLGSVKSVWQVWELRDHVDHVVWQVEKIRDLAMKIIPVLDQYPLLTTKRHDYETWKQAVLLLCEMRRSKCANKWTEANVQEFLGIKKALDDNRRYWPSVEPLASKRYCPYVEPFTSKSNNDSKTRQPSDWNSD